jgi:hypothetical protein
MFAEVQTKCSKCGQAFWLTANDQQACQDKKLRLPDRCPTCRSASASNEVSSALATLEQLRGDALGNLLPDPALLFKDILQLLKDTSAPIQVRRRTFSEWLRGLDLQAVQIEKKLRDGNAADQLLRQRLELIRGLQEVARLRYDAVETEMAQQQKLLRVRLEQLELEEKIAQFEALKKQRIETLQLEEARKHVRLLNDIDGPTLPAPPKKTDPVKAAIDTHRRGVRARSAAKQLVLSDFLTEVQRHYRADHEESIKAVRIRTVMEVYRQDLEALPRDVREFVERVERGEEANRE